MQDLANKLVLVTGAAGGIGLATALAFAREGARLALLDRDGDRLMRARQQVHEASHDGVVPLAAAVDITDESSVFDAHAYLTAEMGQVDVLVNNAGVCVGGEFLQSDPLHIERVILTNLVAPLRLCRMVLPSMVARGSGHIVNLHSSSASLAVPGFLSYASSKGGLATASRIMRRELADTGVNVTLLCPGSVRTPMSEPMIATGKGPGAMPQFDPAIPAAAVVDAVQQGRDVVMVSRNRFMQHLVVWLDRMMPSLLDKYWLAQADKDYFEAASAIGTGTVE